MRIPPARANRVVFGRNLGNAIISETKKGVVAAKQGNERERRTPRAGISPAIQHEGFRVQAFVVQKHARGRSCQTGAYAQTYISFP